MCAISEQLLRAANDRGKVDLSRIGDHLTLRAVGERTFAELVIRLWRLQNGITHEMKRSGGSDHSDHTDCSRPALVGKVGSNGGRMSTAAREPRGSLRGKAPSLFRSTFKSAVPCICPARARIVQQGPERRRS